MSFPPLHRFKVLRPKAVLEACARFFQRVIKLLEIPAPEAEQWIRRITVMEREIMLPIKLVGILMIYSFYFTRWTGYAHTALEINVEAVEYFFWVYVGVNSVFAAFLLGMRRLPLALMQWVVFVMILGDGLFLSALTLVTGGYESILYWLFLGLIVRSAVSVPRATSQILLNATIILCYVLAGVIEISIARNLEEHVRANIAMQRMVRRAAELGVPAGRTGSGASRARVHTNLDNALLATNRPRTLAPLVEDWDEPATWSLGLGTEPENAAAWYR